MFIRRFSVQRRPALKTVRQMYANQTWPLIWREIPGTAREQHGRSGQRGSTALRHLRM